MLSLKTNEQENFISLIPSNSIPKMEQICLLFVFQERIN